MNEYFTIKEVMGFLKVSRATVYRWIEAGELHPYKFGKLVRFKRADLEKFTRSKRKSL
jgi:excisionase family DNA binding protein